MDIHKVAQITVTQRFLLYPVWIQLEGINHPEVNPPILIAIPHDLITRSICKAKVGPNEETHVGIDA
ncbi:hypothetical protein J6590_000257 [Homalodisca vitripennis]|nr:hypothetical protein J6590_000257 [Homalodisca vitripennis]